MTNKSVVFTVSRTLQCRTFQPILSSTPNHALFATSPYSTEPKLHIVDKNLSFLSNSSPPSLSSPRRPIVIVYGWLVAKAKHIHKYGDFYLGKGCDVLHVKVKPLQLLRPSKAQAVVSRILDFVQDEPRRTQPLLVHGFSVGGYLYGETLVKILDDPKIYGPVGSRLRGQIFDSPVDFEGIPSGVGRALTSTVPLQKLIKALLTVYLRLFQKPVTTHYVRSSQAFHENSLGIPSLLLYSRDDHIADPKPIEGVAEKWRKAGVPIALKHFDQSTHVSHFQHYPVEYIEALMQFMRQIGVLPFEEKTAKTKAQGATRG